MTKALGGILVETGVGPLPDGSLDEALGLAVGAWGIDASAGVSELQIATGLCEQGGAKAGAVVGHDATDLEAEVGEVGRGLAQEAAGGSSFFIREQGGEGDTGMVIDGDIEKLPAGAAGFILGIAGEAMAGLVDAGQLLDVDVQQVAGSGQFVAHDGQGRPQHPDLVQLEPGQDTAHGGPAQASGQGDANPVQRSRRSRCTRSISSGEVDRGDRCGRELRSRNPACFSVRKRCTHLAALCRLSLSSAAASFKLRRP